ncbi:Chaperone protein DnaK [Dirofilaria immitis]
MERATSQSISVPIIHYDHEPRSLSRPFEKMEYTLLQKSQQLFNSEMKSLSEKDDAKENSGPVLVGNEGPSIIVKATVCVIAFIIMVICLCFLFV